MSGYGLRSETVDCGALYETIRAGFVAMLRALRVEELDRRVEATPGWRVRDVVAHLAGLTQDLNGGYLGNGDPDAWTQVQVDRFRDSSLEEIIQAWDQEAPAFEGGLQLFGYQATVTAPAFEIARACAGRRSAGQIAAFAWTGDASQFLPLVSQYSTPAVDLTD